MAQTIVWKEVKVQEMQLKELLLIQLSFNSQAAFYLQGFL
jgi:hypothetical protein